MQENTYNGWTNYATWRVALEMFDGRDDWHETHDTKPTRYEFAEELKNEVEVYVDDVLGSDGRSGEAIIAGWVGSFLDDVNWDEIAENILSDWED